MSPALRISLLGELRIDAVDVEITLPSSKKARALLAFLVGTARPHRRERLCELFWHRPDDPKAALRWALTKLRKVVDTPDRVRIIADRERVHFDATDVAIDIGQFHAALRRSRARLSIEELETMAAQLGSVLLDGLDGVGDERFDAWLIAERTDAALARVDVLRQLATYPGMAPAVADKWLRLWRDADPRGAALHAERLGAVKSLEDAALELDRSPVGFQVDAFAPRQSGPSDAPAERSRTTSLAPEALRAQRIRFCDARDGTKIAYATIGSGKPILKAANWLNHLEFDWNSPIWGRTFTEIARRRTFVRYDERGCGLSDWTVADLSFDAFVDDLEAVADKLALERFPLLGMSQGCAVAIEYAVRHPDRVTGLILLGGYAAGWRQHASPEERALREAILTLTELGWGTDNPAYRQIFSQTFMPQANAEELDWFNEFQRLTTSPGNAARFQDAFGHIDVRDRLADVKAPTLVLHSRHDQRIPIDLGRAIAAGIPDAHFVPLESCGHILLDREPAWEACFEAVRRFMSEKQL